MVSNAIGWLASHPDCVERTRACCINLSGATINTANIGFYRGLLETFDLPPEKLCFEVTESATIANLHDASRMIGKVRDFGSKFSLDDFGSGFCSFAQLKNLPTNLVKIDGQFVKSMARGATDRAIVTAMNDVAHSLGRYTVAEYVESPEVIRLLKICGVDKVQGNYISPPLNELPVINIVNLQKHASAE